MNFVTDEYGSLHLPLDAIKQLIENKDKSAIDEWFKKHEIQDLSELAEELHIDY